MTIWEILYFSKYWLQDNKNQNLLNKKLCKENLDYVFKTSPKDLEISFKDLLNLPMDKGEINTNK